MKETKIGQHLKRIRNKWKSIRKEAIAIFSRNIAVTDPEDLSNGNWKQYGLYTLGKMVPENCLNAPVTCSLIGSVPQIVLNRKGDVKFAIMESGTHVRAHSGPTNCRLRAHLGLDIPNIQHPTDIPAESPSRIRVMNEYLTWNNGEIIVFDDSFDHEVWHYNPQNRSRIILIIDMWHPNLTERQIANL